RLHLGPPRIVHPRQSLSLVPDHLDLLAHRGGQILMASGGQFAVSPDNRYILLRRIERAKLLIRNDQMSLQEIALAVGFAHQAHMTDTFRRLAGASPSHFRNKR
ncbi:MAG: helix-turn-helix transcriptional regulator, partial [Spirochaetaceae bacterium]|nr:helix-turn-helix transcriptional regulator [Spirochaetaceae bacterium]